MNYTMQNYEDNGRSTCSAGKSGHCSPIGVTINPLGPIADI